MKKISRAIAAVAVLCAVCFLGGEWPEDTPRGKVVTYDAAAFAVLAVCGIYLKRSEDGTEK